MSNPQRSPEVLVPRFGDYLVEKGLITAADLKRALRLQQALREKGDDRLIGEILIDLGAIDAETRNTVITELIIQLRAALQDANEQLEQRVQQRTAELRRALEKLSELNQLKANFVSNISHELRTPLTHLKGYLELLLAGDLGSLTEGQQNALSVMDRSSERLSRLIEDLILFSVSERDQMNLKVAPFTLSTVCDDSIQKVSQKARDRNIQLVKEFGEESPLVDGDAEKISWVLNQFLDNAIKFTQPGGTVTLRTIKHADEFIQVSVQDTGIGIPPPRIDEIFESFFQIDGSTTRKVGGTGLGLALAKKIIEAHGATIQVTTEEGKGTCFTFQLKVHQEASSKR